MRFLQILVTLLSAISLISFAQTNKPGDASPIPSVLAPSPAPEASTKSADRLTEYQPRFGRSKPLIAIVGENQYTELTDYVVT